MKQPLDVKAIEALEQKYAVLYDCFDRDGKQRCIREQHISHGVFVDGKELDAALSIVPYEPCFQSTVKFDFKIEPVEFDPYLMEQKQGVFKKAHNALITNNGTKVDFDYGLLDERIGDIVHRLDSDESLRSVMGEFLHHYRDFYQKTNIILDAMGYENILFFQDNSGEWQFKIGSAIKHDTGKQTQELFTVVHSGGTIDWTDLVNYTHAYLSPANIRAVNICAMKLGLDPVITDVSIDTEDLFKISQQLSVGQRMHSCARHGDFEQMNKIFEENKASFTFNISDFWAHARIVDEYKKHQQSPEALVSFLRSICALRVDLPTNGREAKRIQEAHDELLARKTSLEEELMNRPTPSIVQNTQLSFELSAVTPVEAREETSSQVTQHFKGRLHKAKEDDSAYALSDVSPSFL